MIARSNTAFPISMCIALSALVSGGCLQTTLPGRSFAGDPPALSHQDISLRDRLRAHVQTLAGEIGERHIWRPDALHRAADYIEQQFRDAGYDTARQQFVERGQPVANLIAEIPGTDRASEIIVIGAHYDTRRRTPGADDNATGVAMTLELARAIRESGPHRHTLRFVAFANEEEPFFWTERMGSRIYAARCKRLQENIVAMISLEMLGFFRDEPGSQTYPPPFNFYYPSRGNFVAWLSDPHSRRLLNAVGGAFRRHASIPSVGLASTDFVVGHSDQWSFWVHGYKALMLTDTAMFRNPNYHKATDTPDTIDYDSLARVASGMIDVVRELADSDERY
jgi:Zn-dependent M28 family amino/carboxypeptidase